MAKTIMCIDDSTTIRQLVRKTLEPKGFSVTEAGDGKAALDLCANSPADLFVVDVNMPVMNGLEFVAELRKKSDYAKTPVVFLTTESSVDKKEVGKDLGASGWIVKPFEPQSFLKVINLLL